jgi:hypothetical protein
MPFARSIQERPKPFLWAGRIVNGLSILLWAGLCLGDARFRALVLLPKY